MKKKAQLPITIRPARQKNELSPKGQKLLELDIRATNLYFTGYTNPHNRTMNLDLLQTPIQV
jgi:aminopeptidase-like protein